MDITSGYTEVRERINAAALRAGRSADEITLVAVTKTWPADVVVEAYRAGLRHFGENRAGELSEKRPEVASILGAASAEIVWHAIGDLQSRKTSIVAEHADVFHALDRLKIARRLSRHLQEAGTAAERPLPVFLEVNVSGESSKAGFNCSSWEEDDAQRSRLAEVARTVAELPGLLPQGLMTMAPWQVEAAVIRTVFRRTRQLAEWLQTAVPLAAPAATWSKLSMGMTDDYEIAVEEGATHLRVGRAIFGERG